MAFEDANGVEPGSRLQTDVCIVGAGPAGISTALELSGSGLDVLLLDSGGLHPERDAQRLGRGERSGNPYPPLERARVRAFGGTSRHWPTYDAMMARPLESIDLDSREGLPHSGWPFDSSHLEPFYRRAHDLVGLTTTVYDLETWAGPEAASRLALAEDVVGTTVIQSAPPDAFLRTQARLRGAADVTVLLHATVRRIATEERPDVISHLQVAAAPQRDFTVGARSYVLATGGIENARLLLLGNPQNPGGLGNHHDLVGRFFMEHLWMQTGRFFPAEGAGLPSPSVYQLRHRGTERWRGMLALRPDVLRREGLLNGAFFIDPADRFHASAAAHSLAALRRLRRQRPLQPDRVAHLRTVISHPQDLLSGMVGRVRKRLPLPPTAFLVKSMSEQSPNPASRVTLGHRQDRYGLQVPHLQWRPTARDVNSVRRAQELVAAEIAAAGVGRLESTLDTPAPVIFGHWHHMGTTRMHESPRQGVVDANGRVHGIRNLYVAGSSVFPTAGYVNPTLTIVALSTRLGRHLAAVLHRS